MTAQNTLRNPLAWLLGLAMLIRIYVAAAWPSLWHPDENFQSLEQAHRLAFGYGVVPWEFHDGVRSMVEPFLLSLVMRAASWVSASPDFYLLIVHSVIAALSLLIVYAAWATGRRYSVWHALVAALVAASWFQIVNFADRTLSEAVAADFFVAAVAMASVRGRNYSRLLLLGIGASLAMAVCLRTDLAPGCLLIALWAGRLRLRDFWPFLILGTLPVLALFGVSDWITWGAPFHSYYKLFQEDLLQGVLAGQGTEPFNWLWLDLADRWAPIGAVLVLLVVLALRRYTLWVLAGLAVLLVHSFIGHKEYRYIFPAVSCFVIAAALVSVDLMVGLCAIYRAQRVALWTSVLMASWFVASLALAITAANAPDWKARADHIRLSYFLYRQPNLCGLLLDDYAWYNTGGYTYLHRKVPMYETATNPLDSVATTEAVNYILVREGQLSTLPPGYQLATCDQERGGDTMCLAVRPGKCAVGPGLHPIE